MGSASQERSAEGYCRELNDRGHYRNPRDFPSVSERPKGIGVQFFNRLLERDKGGALVVHKIRELGRMVNKDPAQFQAATTGSRL